MTIAYLRRKDANTLIARDESGEFEAHVGDSLDMGDGIVIAVMGPDQLAGGSVVASVGALVVGFVGLVVAALMGIGKGIGS